MADIIRVALGKIAHVLSPVHIQLLNETDESDPGVPVFDCSQVGRLGNLSQTMYYENASSYMYS